MPGAEADLLVSQPKHRRYDRIGTMTSREELHRLVDHIPEADVAAARKILRALADPVWQSLVTAPLDDEPETDQERAEVEAARKETGPGASHEKVLRDFSL